MSDANLAIKVKCFIIHLERAEKRAAQVRALSQCLPHRPEIVYAVDGAAKTFAGTLCYKKKLIKPAYPFDLRSTEVATFLSHRKCWQRIIDEDMDAGLIVEDDVKVTEPEFGKALALATKHFQQGDFVRFPIKCREKHATRISVDQNVTLFRPMQVGLGAQVQLVSRAAAETLLSKTQLFDRPIDTYLQLSWEHELRILSVWPSGVSEKSESLGGSLIGAKQSFWTKIMHEVQRPIYRIKLEKLARKKGMFK